MNYRHFFNQFQDNQGVIKDEMIQICISFAVQAVIRENIRLNVNNATLYYVFYFPTGFFTNFSHMPLYFHFISQPFSFMTLKAAHTPNGR